MDLRIIIIQVLNNYKKVWGCGRETCRSFGINEVSEMDEISEIMENNLSKKILSAALVLFLLGCGIQYFIKPKSVSCEKQIFAMNTIMTFEAHGRKAEEAVNAVIEEMNRLDALLSTGNEMSEISGVNRNGEGEISEDTEKILVRALDIYEQTEGAFDCTIYPLMKLWGFDTKEYHVPTEEELKKTLVLVDSSQVRIVDMYEVLETDDEAEEKAEEIDEDVSEESEEELQIAKEWRQVILGGNQEIDLGGIAKGYASDRAIEIFEAYGIESGIVSLGGNVKTLNKNAEGDSWKIGIRDPEGENSDVLAVVEVENQAVVTSGGYERYFEENGETYIHIIDPATGYPAENGLVSVTIISEEGMLADALSTALYIMGEEKAVEYWQKSEENFEFVLVADDGEILVTEGLVENMNIQKEYSVVKR